MSGRSPKSARPGWERATCESIESRLLLAVTPIPFQHFVIDPNPGTDPDEKLLLDVDGDGKQDAVIGFSNFIAGSKGGIYWYQFPHSGNPADAWNRYAIASDGKHAYEDMVPYDVNGDGATDLIASYNNQIIWFDNPRGHGGDPRSDPWVQHVIGPDQAHEMVLGDFDGDGKIDIATNVHIHFQNSPTSWTTISAPQITRGERGVTVFDSGAGLGSVNLVGIAPSPFPMVWFENPRDHGGNARTDTWVARFIANSYKASDTSVAIAFATEDINGDGRMDVITSFGESQDNSLHPGGMYWWEAPANRATGTWIKHVIDDGLQDTHRLRLADMNGDGITDIVFSEQEQSDQDRVGIYYQTDTTGDNWQLQNLSFQSGHNQDVGDIDGDGDFDILNAPHGVYTHVNPIEIYMSQLKDVVTTVPAGWTDSDIGAPGLPGSAQSSDGANWVVTGGGTDIFNSSDQFNFASRNVGDTTTIIARLTQLTLTDPSAKAGIMLRASNDPSAAFADVVSTPGAGVAFQWRSASGAAAGDAHVSGIPGTPQWLKLVRSGSTISAYYGSDGKSWTSIGTPQTIALPTIALGGLAATARNNAMLNTGVFTDVSISSSLPVAVDDSKIVNTNIPTVIDVLANDQLGSAAVDPTTLTASTAPAHGQVSVDPASGKVTYTPDADFTGADSFQYFWQDGLGQTTNVATVNLTIQDNQPPVAGNDSAATTVNVSQAIDVLVNDSDSDGAIDPTSVAIAAGPQHGTASVNSLTGAITFTPATDYVGPDVLYYTVRDNAGATSAPALVLLAVNPPADTYLSSLNPTSASNGWGPYERDQSNGENVANDGHAITLNGKTYARGLGVHGQSDIRYTIPAGAQWFYSDVGVDDEVGNNGNVIFQVYLDNVLKYDSGVMTGASATKSIALNIAGKSTLRLVVSPNGSMNYDHSDWAGARISNDPAGPPNAAPTAANDSAATSKNTTVKINVLGNDTDPDGSIDPTTVLITQQPASGTAVVNSDGTISYTPSASFVGTDSLKYTVKDNLGAISNAATVGLTVNDALPTYLSDLNWTSAVNGWGSVEKNKSNGEKASGDGKTITLNGQTYAKGLGTNSVSDISYAINKKYSQFVSDIGIDDEVGNNGSVNFQVWLDDVLVYDSGVMTGASATKSISLNISGKSTLRLVVTNGGDNTNYDHADWAGATLIA